ncbi:uncharacterized protein [Mytilus edulis]|uniref:uncharacterized protein isoform X1 n=1 Tax=Mytilus edulis TaxID=6550 RepID=UPI0039F0C58C
MELRSERVPCVPKKKVVQIEFKMATKGVEGKKLVYCTLDGVKYSVYVDPMTNHNLNSTDPLLKAQSQKIIIDAVRAKTNTDDDDTTTENQQEENSNRATLTFCDVCSQGVERGVRHVCPDVEQSPDDESSSNKEDSTGTNIIWTKSNTLLLIEEYRANKNKMEKGILRKKVVWEKIAKMLCSKGFSVNGDQVNGKWKTLMRGYKSVKDNNKKSGAGKKSYEFEEVLDELFENDPIIKPVLTLSSTDNNKKSATATDKPDDEEIATPKPAKKPRKTTSADIADTIKQYLQESKQHQEDTIERQERMHKDRINAYKGVEDALRSFLAKK